MHYDIKIDSAVNFIPDYQGSQVDLKRHQTQSGAKIRYSPVVSGEPAGFTARDMSVHEKETI